MKAINQLIPNNPKANYIAHKKEIIEAIFKVLESGSYILGEEVRKFEEEFAKYLGAKFSIGVGSGTEALHIALRACQIKPNDEIITAAHTAVATVAAIELCGAIPILVDINLNTYTIDPNQIEDSITDKTKGIIPVHLYGHPAEMEDIMYIAKRHNLFVIEDCAQSHGAMYNGRMTGTWGDVSAFSFYPTKNLGALGDGGAIVTDNQEIANRAKLLREYGWRKRYISEIAGFNSRLDEIQAAILREKLHFLDEENFKRQSLAKIYNEKLPQTNIILPFCSPRVKHVYHQYVIRSKYRDSLKEFLATRGIGTLIHYPLPIHLQPAYKGRIKFFKSLINTERISKEILSLPIYPELTYEEVFKIIEQIINWDKLLI